MNATEHVTSRSLRTQKNILNHAGGKVLHLDNSSGLKYLTVHVASIKVNEIISMGVSTLSIACYLKTVVH